MSKFKKGDRVRYVRDEDFDGTPMDSLPDCSFGDEFTVTYGDGHCVKVDPIIGKTDTYWSSRRFDLVTPEPTLAEYKAKVREVIIAELGRAYPCSTAALLKSLDLESMVTIPTKVGARLLLKDGRKVIRTTSQELPWCVYYCKPEGDTGWWYYDKDIGDIGIDRILSDGEED